MDACPACTASIIRHSKLHCTSPGCVWLICTTCMSTIDKETGAYNKPGIWGNPDGYLKGGESVCQPPNTPKPNAPKPSPSTKPTDQPQ